MQVIVTYRSTDLDRSHPLSAMLADLHRDGTGSRIQFSGLDQDDVSAYVAEAGYHDEELARALASVTGGNPFFLIEALRHVDESGGRWDPSTLPQGVREAVSRRLSRLAAETNKALAAAAVVGSRFAVELVEGVVGDDLVDAFDEACKAGIVIEEPGGHYRFNHALVRQSLLAELPSVRRMRLHQKIAATLEEPARPPTTNCSPNWRTTISNARGRETPPRPSSTAGVPQTRRWPGWPTKAPPISTIAPFMRWRRSTTSCPTATTRSPRY